VDFTQALPRVLIGSSPAMATLRRYVQKVGACDANVLITGATGTGKELDAEAIHRASRRAARPFVIVNCAAIPDALMESELFGYERGAFTGAANSYLGKLRLADTGTVFLDEIGEMSLLGQAKILRVLESGEVFPLGARGVTQLNVRFIAATNQDLEPLVMKQAFRHDLFFRLNVARIYLPPLNERPEDIIELLLHYIHHFNAKYGQRVQGPVPELAARLHAYEWPGNVRELRNFAEAIFIDPPEGAISLEHLPEYFRRIFGQYREDRLSERDELLSALSRTNWNKKMAARELRWSRMTLYRKMEKYNITRGEVNPIAETTAKLTVPVLSCPGK
jgi:transcriptional regulator with PAS, ATPase and Fis domain